MRNFVIIDREILMKEFDMKEIVYREARLDEYQKIGKVLAGAFMDYPFMTLIKDDLKKPEYYPAFLELLYSLLTRLYIKGETCLVAERDGEILAIALLQQKDFSILSYLLNGIIKLFRFITPRNLLKYLDLVDRSEQHLKKSGNFDWYLMMLGVNASVQNQGIGSAFLQGGVEPYLKSKGCKRLGLITSTEKNVLFYEKNKYELLDSMMLEYGTKSIGNWAFVKILDN